MYKDILVPVDLTENSFSDKAVRAACGILAEGGKLHLLSIQLGVQMPLVGSFFSEDLMSGLLKNTQAELVNFCHTVLPDKKINYQLHVVEAKPADGILKLSNKLKVDCIVLSSHKRSKLDAMMLGSVATKVVGRAKMPVMVVKPGK